MIKTNSVKLIMVREVLQCLTMLLEKFYMLILSYFYFLRLYLRLQQFSYISIILFLRIQLHLHHQFLRKVPRLWSTHYSQSE